MVGLPQQGNVISITKMPSVQLTTPMKSKCEIIWKTGLKELDEAKDIPSLHSFLHTKKHCPLQ